jgi:hypothetical protein
MDTNYRYQYGQMLSGEMETNAISDINTLKITRHQRQLAETASIRETTNLITQPMRTMDNMPGFVDMGMDFLNKGNVISDLPSQDIYRLLNHLNQLEGLGIQNPYQSYYDFMQGIPTDQNIKVYNPKSGTSYVYEDVADMLNMIRNPTTTAESIRQSFVGGRNAIQIMDPETGDIFKKFGPGQLLKQAQEMQIPPSQYSQEFFNVDNLKAIAINELGIRKMMSDEMYGTPDEEAMLKTNELLEDIADALDSNLQKLNDNLAGTSKTASQQDLTIMLDEASKEIATKWGLDPDKVSDQILDAYTPQEVYNYRTELRGQTIEVPNKAGQEVVDNTVTELADRIYNIRRNVDTGVVDTALEMPEVTKSTYINKETAAQLTESYRNILNVLDIREDMVADFDIQTAKSVPGKISSEGDVFTIQSKGIDYEMLNKAIAEKYNVPEELMESLYLDFYNMPAGKTAAQDMAMGLTNTNKLAETPIMDRTTVIPIEETRVDIRDMLDLDTEDMTGVLDQRASTYGDIADDIARLPELPDMGPMQPAEWIDFEAIESETTPAVTESKRKSIWDWLNFKNKENKAIVEAMDDIDGGLPDDIPSKTTGGIDDLLSNNKGSLFDMNNMEYAGLRTEAGLRANSIDIGLGLTELIANLARTQPVVEATSGIPVVGDVLESTSFETQLTEQETMNKYFYDELQKLGGWDTYANMTYSQQNDVISAAQAAYREDTGEIFTMTPEVTAPQMKMTPEELTAYQNVTGMDPFAQSNAEMSTPFYMIGDMSTAGNTGMLAATGLFWGLGNLYEDYKFGQEGWDRYTPEVSQEMLDISPYAGMTQEAYDLRNVPIEDIWRAIGDRIEGESGQSYYIEESTFRQLAGQRMAREDTYGTAESQQQFIQALEGYDEWLDSEIKNKGSVMDKIFSVPDTFFDIITGSTSNRERNVLGATGETEEELFNRFTQDVLSKIGNGEQVTNVDVNNPTEVNNDTTNNMTFNMTFNIEGDMEEEQSNSVRDNMTEFAKKFANMSLA